MAGGWTVRGRIWCLLLCCSACVNKRVDISGLERESESALPGLSASGGTTGLGGDRSDVTRPDATSEVATGSQGLPLDGPVAQPCVPEDPNSRCPEVVCPPSSDCRQYLGNVAAGSCVGTGFCATSAQCDFSDAPPSSACLGGRGSCDGSGHCISSEGLGGDGTPCQADGECASEQCEATRDGGRVCCATPCDGACQACSETGLCVDVPASDVRCPPVDCPEDDNCFDYPEDPAQPSCSDLGVCAGLDALCAPARLAERGAPCGEGRVCGAAGCVGQLAAGATCELGSDCSTGFCAADREGSLRCCESACNGPCERCSEDGTCSAAPDTEPACPAVDCPTDNVCRDYAGDLPAEGCAEPGRCRDVSDCEFSPSAASRDGAACNCGADGNCTLVAGEACSSNGECASGACRPTAAGASLCCAQPCSATQVCAGDGSSCALAAVCNNDQQRCAAGNLERCVGGQWEAAEDCGSLGCNLAQGGCLLGPGEACSSNAQCGAGSSCQATAGGARVCCTGNCEGACRRCAASGTSCTNIADDAACGVIACPPSESCRQFPASINQNRCSGGFCGTGAGLCTGTPINNGQSCSGTALCDAQGGCTVPKRAQGAACTTSSQCADGRPCVDGVCCESTCTGDCQQCRPGTGTCDLMPATDFSCPPVTCPADSPCVDFPPSPAANACSSLGSCATPANSCARAPSPAGASCDPNGTSSAGRCDANGNCNTTEVICGLLASSPVCDGGNSFCCQVPAASPRFSCIAPTAACVLPGGGAAAAGVSANARITCDEDSDCGAGLVCCAASVAGNVALAVECRADCPASSPATANRRLCRSPAIASSAAICANCDPIQILGDAWGACRL